EDVGFQGNALVLLPAAAQVEFDQLDEGRHAQTIPTRRQTGNALLKGSYRPGLIERGQPGLQELPVVSAERLCGRGSSRHSPPLQPRGDKSSVPPNITSRGAETTACASRRSGRAGSVSDQRIRTPVADAPGSPDLRDLLLDQLLEKCAMAVRRILTGGGAEQ